MYASDSEDAARKVIFAENQRKIEEHNLKQNGGEDKCRLELNQFSDLVIFFWANSNRLNLTSNFQLLTFLKFKFKFRTSQTPEEFAEMRWKRD